jgi:CRP-like cAMP-binding protein
VAKSVSTDSDDAWVVSAKAGECLFREGEKATHLFFIESGQVELLKSAGSDSRRLALFEGGEFVGELPVLEGGACEATARVVRDATLLRCDGETFAQLVRQRPEIAVLMVRRLARRLSQVLAQRPQASGRTGERAAASSGAESGRRTGTTGRHKAVSTKGIPRLVVSGGSDIPLPSQGEALVGRADPQARSRPEVELSAHDTQRSLSRRHARIVREGDVYLVSEEPGVPNGTFVNGERLKAGERRPLKDGDEVRFGLVKTTFRSA